MDLKIAIGTWETPPVLGGPAYYIKELVERLSRYVDVVLIIPKHGSIEKKKGLITHKIGTIDIPILRVCLFAAKASLSIKKFGVDLIHDNGVLGLSNFMPFIETWHHSGLDDKRYSSPLAHYFSLYRELLTLRGIKKADSIIAISSTAKQELITKYSVPSSRINIVNHGVDVDFFKPLSNHQLRYYSKKDDGLTLLYVGSLSKRKNLESLILALYLIRKKNRNIHLLVAGSGVKAPLQALATSLNLKDYVYFLGGVSREHILELYNIADYVILPSYKEGFGMTILEALACNKPVIMTPVGISEIIRTNDLGIVTEDFTPSSIAHGIESAINKGKYKDLREFVVKNFNWTKTIQATLQLYKTIVENY